MAEMYFTAPWVFHRMRSGLIAPYLGALAAELEARDYSHRIIRRQLHNADSFGWWLKEKKVEVPEITDEVVGGCIAGMHRSARASAHADIAPTTLATILACACLLHLGYDVRRVLLDYGPGSGHMALAIAGAEDLPGRIALRDPGSCKNFYNCEANTDAGSRDPTAISFRLSEIPASDRRAKRELIVVS